MKKLKNKVVVITGAYGGLGKSLCEEFGKHEAKIIALGRDESKLLELSQNLNQQNIENQYFCCDVRDKESCEKAIKQVIKHFGRIDVLINNAGITNIALFNSNTHADIIENVMSTNFYGSVYCTNFALNSIVESKGAIINISSVAGYAPLYGRTAYCSSKFAMEGFFRTLGCELKTKGVHNMIVYPTFIQTAIRDDVKGNVTTGESLTPEYCSEKIIKALKARKRTLILGKTAKKVYWINKLAPSLYEKMMIKNMAEKVKD